MAATKGPIALPWLAVLALAAAGLGVALMPLGKRPPEPTSTTAKPLAGDRAEVRERTAAGDGPRSTPLVWMPPAPNRRWECIVIHHSANEIGGADRFDGYHRDRGFDELGYHFVIGNGSDTAAGQIETGPRWLAQKHGAHCKTPNEYYNQHGIGICIVGNLEKHPPDAKQWKSLVSLVRLLSKELNIPPDKILSHGQITGQTLCPGKFLDLDKLRREAAAGS